MFVFCSQWTTWEGSETLFICTFTLYTGIGRAHNWNPIAIAVYKADYVWLKRLLLSTLQNGVKYV